MRIKKRITAALMAVVGMTALLCGMQLNLSVMAVEGDADRTDYTYDGEWEDLFYEITDDNEIRITHALQSTATCDIPDTIEDKPVTEIADNTFAQCFFLTEITLPDSIRSIGKQAFSACDKLESIRLPENLESMGAGTFDNCTSLKKVTFGSKLKEIPQAAFYSCTALEEVTLPAQAETLGKELFYGCTALKSIKIPESMTTFNDYVFEGCSALTAVNLPASLTFMGSYVFEGCSSLESIDVAPENPSYQDKDGILFSKDGSRLIKFPDGCTISDYTVPDDCRSLDPWSFINASHLEHIDLNNVTAIGNEAFFFCTSLKDITIPEGIERLETSTFAYCSALEQISLPKSLTYIGSYCFYACGSVAELTVPEAVTYIGDYAFFNCVGMRTLNLPDAVENLGRGAMGYYAEVNEDGKTQGDSQKIKDLTINFNRNQVIYDYVEKYALHGTGTGGFPWWILWTAGGVLIVTAGIIILVKLRQKAAIPKPVQGGRLGSETKRPNRSNQK